MKISKNLQKLAYTYSIASVFLGPLIFILGFGFTRGGGDFCDAVYYLPDGSLDPHRITEFQNAQIFQVVGASLMIVLGLAIIIYSFALRHKKDSKINVWATLTVLLMILGYGVVILLSGSSGQVC